LLGLDAILPLFLILVLSLSFHEAAHAWTADRLGDPTARLLGRLTLNPLAHIDWIGTVLFPILALYSGLPIIGWAKPVPVNVRHLKSPRRDFAIVAAAGPASNLILAVGFTAAFFLLGYEVADTSLPSQLLFLSVSLNVFLAVFNISTWCRCRRSTAATCWPACCPNRGRA
jgi:Zn-dependent protease